MQRATQMGHGPLSRMGGAPSGQDANQQPADGGQQAPDPQQTMAMYNQAVQELEQVASKIMQLQAVIDPEGQALLVPIAQAGKALMARVQESAKRQQAGPGAPSAAQASGGGSPAPNPDEGGAPSAMAA